VKIFKVTVMQWFKQKNSNAWTAIRCTDNKTSIATVTKRENLKPLVNVVDIQAGNLNDEAAFKNLTNKHKLKSANCTFVLGFSRYQLLQIEKPNVPQDEIKQAVSWKLKDLIDYPVEEATIEVIDIPPDPANAKKQQYVFAIAANNPQLGEVTNQLLDAGVNLQAIDARVFAQRNIASLLEEKNRGLAMLSFNSTGGLLTFTAGGELYHARRIEIDGERNKTAFETISLELQRSLDHFDSQFPYITINKLMLAPFDLRETFCEHLRDYINLPIAQFDLSDIFDFDAEVDLADLGKQASLLPVLGAALREGPTQ
jgi:MSHA biogenesis protein MshI